MKKIDFLDNDDDNDNRINFKNQFNELANRAIKSILKQKEDLIRISLLELEGKYPSDEEVKRFGGIHRREDRPDEELIIWKGKPLLWMKVSLKDMKVEYKFLYNLEMPPESDGSITQQDGK